MDIKELVLAHKLDEEQKRLWVEKVIELVKADLRKEYNISFDDLEVVFEEDYESCGSYSNGKISFNYMLNDDNLIDNLITIAHELRHYAQDNGIRKDLEDGVKPLDKHYIIPDTSIIDCYFMLKNLKPEDKKNLGIFNLNQRLKAFLCKGYYGSELEMDARGYSLNFVSDLLETINEKDLTKEEKTLLKGCSKALEQQLETEGDIIMWLENGNKQIDNACVRQIKTMQQEILDSEKFKFALEYNLKGNSLLISLVGVDYLNGVIQSLEFAYNDDLAHEMFSNFVRSYDSLPGWNYGFLTRLYARTKIELTQDEETMFSTIIAKHNKNENASEIRKNLDSARQIYLSHFNEEYGSTLMQ